MRRWLYATRTIHGDPSALDATLREAITELLAQASAGRVDDVAPDGSQLLRLPGRILGVDAEKTVRVRTGVASRRGPRTVIPLRWEPEPIRLAFPTFEGSIELSPADDARAELALVGSYTVPLGPLGVAADATAFRSVAEWTAERLLEGLDRGLTGHVLEPTDPHPPRRAPIGRLTVRDVMTEDPVVLVEDLPVRTAALMLFHLDVSGAPVVSQEGDLIGVLSDRDLLEKEALPPARLGRKGAEAERRRDAVTVGDACTRPAVVTIPDAPLREAARRMVSDTISRLVVVDESRIVGILTRHDVLQAMLRSDRDLQLAVDAAVADHDGVHAKVHWGAVHVEGRVPLRSQVAPLLAALRATDGVIAVESEVDFAEDDILPSMVAGPHL